MSEIKAIETSYKGYRFRSRLEARWAVFFDALDLKWEYELEGFEFNSIRYLPDFYLPELGKYLEIKPVIPPIESEAMTKFIAASLAMLEIRLEPDQAKSSRRTPLTHDISPPIPIHKPRMLMCCGIPGIPKLKRKTGNWELRDGAVVVGCAHAYGQHHLHVQAFAMCGGENRLDIWPLYFDPNTGESLAFRVCRGANGATEPTVFNVPVLPNEISMNAYMGDGVSYNHLRLVRAYQAARSARFEFGESGAPRGY